MYVIDCPECTKTTNADDWEEFTTLANKKWKACPHCEVVLKVEDLKERLVENYN